MTTRLVPASDSKKPRVFTRLLNAALAGGFSLTQLEDMATDTSQTPAGDARRASALRHREWLTENERRLQMRLQFERFFESYDVLIMPVQPRAAIGHDHSPNVAERVVDIDGVERNYMDLFGWIAPAGLAYLPATVVPVGVDEHGLPIGVQIVGVYLHDMTTLRLAELVAELYGGTPTPPIAA